MSRAQAVGVRGRLRRWRWRKNIAGNPTRSNRFQTTTILPARSFFLSNRTASAALRAASVVSRTGEAGQGCTAESGWSRTAAKVDAGARLQRQILDLSRAVNALSRAERSTESGSIERSISDGQKVAPLRLPSNSNLTGRARGSLEGSRMSPGAAAVAGKLSDRIVASRSYCAGNVSRREFARPSSDGRVSNDGGGRTGITINSSPTVVINASAGGALQQDVIGALRAHREELFDQLKRESARRERAQF